MEQRRAGREETGTRDIRARVIVTPDNPVVEGSGTIDLQYALLHLDDRGVGGAVTERE